MLPKWGSYRLLPSKIRSRHGREEEDGSRRRASTVQRDEVGKSKAGGSVIPRVPKASALQHTASAGVAAAAQGPAKKAKSALQLVRIVGGMPR